MARREALLRLHKTLQARRLELRKRFRRELHDLQHNDATSDAVDAAFEATGEELASQLAELEAKELVQVERALVRLKQGKYGLCDGCAVKIPVMRLNALPYSTLCIKCQRESEHDSNWLNDRLAANWESVRDHDPNEDRTVNLSRLEMDYTK